MPAGRMQPPTLTKLPDVCRSRCFVDEAPRPRIRPPTSKKGSSIQHSTNTSGAAQERPSRGGGSSGAVQKRRTCLTFSPPSSKPLFTWCTCLSISLPSSRLLLTLGLDTSSAGQHLEPGPGSSAVAILTAVGACSCSAALGGGGAQECGPVSFSLASPGGHGGAVGTVVAPLPAAFETACLPGSTMASGMRCCREGLPSPLSLACVSRISGAQLPGGGATWKVLMGVAGVAALRTLLWSAMVKLKLPRLPEGPRTRLVQSRSGKP
mmetsp:Transcript_67251/g.132649  ORF Transcript_67251/g.132649 Transcript_67251/m.132649 type:complete len:265 (-) Transcript_67251:513-1307(-)